MARDVALFAPSASPSTFTPTFDSETGLMITAVAPASAAALPPASRWQGRGFSLSPVGQDRLARDVDPHAEGVALMVTTVRHLQGDVTAGDAVVKAFGALVALLLIVCLAFVAVNWKDQPPSAAGPACGRSSAALRCSRAPSPPSPAPRGTGGGRCGSTPGSAPGSSARGARRRRTR